MMGSREHLDTLIELIGPGVASLDDYVPPPADPERLTMDVIGGLTADLEEVAVFRYSMDLARLALYDGPVTCRRFRATPEGPILLTQVERTRDQMAALRCAGNARARARLADEFGDDWYRQVRRMVEESDAKPCPLCSREEQFPRLALLPVE